MEILVIYWEGPKSENRRWVQAVRNSEDRTGRARKFRWTAVAWMVPAAVLMVIIGLLAESPWWLIVFLGGIPLLAGAAIGALAGRETRVESNRYQVTSQGARSQGILRVSCSGESVRAALNELVKNSRRFILESLEGPEVAISAGMNFKSWGEVIRVSVSDGPDGGSVVSASVEPKLRTTMIDYGQGRRDLEDLFSAIEGRVYSMSGNESEA